MSDCYDRASDSGAYALDALSREEAAEFEAACGDSEELRAEAAGFAETAALLALAVPPAAPSPALRASVLAAIDAVPQLAPQQTGGLHEEQPIEVPQKEQSTGVRPGESRLAEGRHLARRPSRSRPTAGALRALAVAAAAVVLFAGGALAGGLLTSVSAERTADRFAALNAAPDVLRTNTPLPQGGSISFVGSEELGASAVVLHDAELPEGRTFQAWYVEDSGPASAGVVEPDEDGSVYRMLEGRYEGETVAMTIEPEGGSPEPTTPPMVLTEAPQAS